MSVLKSYFDYDCNQCSPVCEDYVRVVNLDESGNEIITYAKFDYPKYQQSLGDFSLWSVDSLMKAGINPNFVIHTGLSTRLEGLDFINEASKVADSILAESKTE